MEVLLVKSDVFEEAMAEEALRFGTYDSGAPCALLCLRLPFAGRVPSPRRARPGMASDQEPDNSDGVDEDAGAVAEREGLPDGPEASAALSVAPMPRRVGADGSRRAGPFHD